MSDNPLADPLAWRLIKAPSLVDLEIMAREVFVRLPENFRALCTDLVIQVEDFATDEVLDEMGIENPFDLMGLFQGVGLPFQSESAPTHMPNMVWLYRRPILDYWAEHDENSWRHGGPRAGPRDRPSFRPLRRRHGGDRGGRRVGGSANPFAEPVRSGHRRGAPNGNRLRTNSRLPRDGNDLGPRIRYAGRSLDHE